MTYAELVRHLRRRGIEFDRQASGSHEIWLNPANGRSATIPHHEGREIPTKTLASILRDLGLTLDDLRRR
jgi:predicted RNA binding protein YcfA (HicA-like mRNA interferase family)